MRRVCVWVCARACLRVCVCDFWERVFGYLGYLFTEVGRVRVPFRIGLRCNGASVVWRRRPAADGLGEAWRDDAHGPRKEAQAVASGVEVLDVPVGGAASVAHAEGDHDRRESPEHSHEHTAAGVFLFFGPIHT